MASRDAWTTGSGLVHGPTAPQGTARDHKWKRGGPWYTGSLGSHTQGRQIYQLEGRRPRATSALSSGAGPRRASPCPALKAAAGVPALQLLLDRSAGARQQWPRPGQSEADKGLQTCSPQG